jgi:hypothetical protein
VSSDKNISAEEIRAEVNVPPDLARGIASQDAYPTTASLADVESGNVKPVKPEEDDAD